MTKAEHEQKWEIHKFGESPIFAIRDWEYSNYPDDEVKDKGWNVALGYYAGLRKLGIPEQAKQFQKDLADAIAYCEGNP